MPTSDTPGPRRMPRSEFIERIENLVARVVRYPEGVKPDAHDHTEASILCGYQAANLLRAIGEPPWICPRCRCAHQGWDALCYKCSKETEAEAREAAIRADERAKVEAEVRAELAQKGSA